MNAHVVPLDREAVKRLGASPEAISAHYDVGNEFFALWLDSTLTYTCADWDGAADLDRAQSAKIDGHARGAGVGEGARTLDVGCVLQWRAFRSGVPLYVLLQAYGSPLRITLSQYCTQTEGVREAESAAATHGFSTARAA